MFRLINKYSILNFYKNLKFTGFKTISPDRKKELDVIVEKNIYYFRNNTETKLTLMTVLAEKLTTSAKNYGLLNGDEQAYFFVKMLDPELKYLILYDISNNTEDIKPGRKIEFYDKYLIILEKYYYRQFIELECIKDNIKK